MAPFLERVLSIVKTQHLSQEKQQYNIVVVITDGQIDDLDETIKVKLSGKP